MSKPTSLMRRGAVYYAIVNVPADLLGAMGGKRQVWKSLRTADHAEAKRRLPVELDQWLSTFDALRRQRSLTPVDVATAVWDHYTDGLTAGDRERASRPTEADIEAATDKAIAEAIAKGDLGSYGGINAMADVEAMIGAPTWAAGRRRARLARLRADLGAGDTRLIEVDADAFLTRHGFRIARHGEQYRDLCNQLMRAEIEHLTRYAERDAGNYAGKVGDPIVVEPAIRTDDMTASAQTIMGLFAKYERENPNNIRAETFTQSRRDVRHFADFVGPRVKPSKIAKRHVREWKELLAEFPVKGAEIKAFAGMSPAQIVAANKALGTPKATLSRQTVRRYMSSLGGFCRWMVRNDYLEANPVADMLPTKTGPTTKRLSFTDAQLTTVFTSPLFSTCLGDGWRDLDQPGNIAVRDHRYWIPLVMLYSGARPGEIAQLFVTDVREHHGISTMFITAEEGTGKRTKTKGSQRAVPIHSALIRLGFLDYVKATAARSERQVFPEIDIPETGQIAAEFSREFNRYLVRIGVKEGAEIVAYGFRHTFIDRARVAGFMDAEIAMVAGHDTGESKKTMTSGYGNEQQGTLARRRQIVESMTFSL